MKCSRCGFEMADTKTYCNQCGTVLRSSPSYSPQMNDKRPPPASEYGMQSQAFSYQQLSLSPSIGVFSAILYFMAALIAAFGFVGMFMTFGTDTRISAIAVFFGLGSLLVSVFIFKCTSIRKLCALRSLPLKSNKNCSTPPKVLFAMLL